MTRKPIIGVASAAHQYNMLLPVYGIGAHYISQTSAAGGIPLQIPILENASQEDLEAIIRQCDGFLFPGGADFAAEWYGEHRLPHLKPDASELSLAVQDTALRLIRLAVQSGKPILGICLGVQILNVAMGGGLIQDIPTQVPTTLCHGNTAKLPEDRARFAHTVRIAENSLLRTLVGSESIRVNSFHHQAVKAPAPGFRVTAWAEDGVIEALESETGPILAVQWHPENLAAAGVPEAQALFRWLVRTATDA